MNTKHTPGPWKQYRDSRGRLRIQGNVPGAPVAYIEELNNTGGTGQDRANASLIAAAPDGLSANVKALEALLWAEAAGLPVYEHIEQVRAAIAKATFDAGNT